MRFESISISNYRQYKNLELIFPPEKDTDLHVIIASNGIGKTNMLNAINWCLYGDEPHLGDTKDSLSICNYTALDDGKSQGLKNVIVKVSINLSIGQEEIILERTTEVSTATNFSQPPQLKAKIISNSGDGEILMNNDAQELINRYLPCKIRQYFFFDGEQLHNYFGREQDSSHVKDSIYEISQVNVVTNTRTHLDNIIREFQHNIATLNPEIDNLNKEKESAENEKKTYENNIKVIEQNIANSEKEVSNLSSKISGTEDVVVDNNRYEENEKELQNLRKEQSQQDEKLKVLVRKFYISLMMYKTNISTKEYIMDKISRGVLPPDIDIGLIKKSLSMHECAICQNHIDERAENHLQKLLDKYKVSTSVSNKLMEIKNDVARAVQDAENYKTEKEALFKEIRATNDKYKNIETENEALRKKIASCSTVKEIGDWMKQKEEHQTLIKENSQKLGRYEKEIEHLDQKIASYEKKINSAIHDVAKCDEMKAQLNFATDAREIVSSIEKEMTTEVRRRMEQETMNIFSNLIWKKDTYGTIELDDNYNLKLFHKYTKESCLGSCSAAERELLALAFTIALHKVSGHDGVLFIDTPVGRVSDTNRENFAKSLIEVSKAKQLILAFTPSEFSEEIRSYFNSSVLSSFRKMVIIDEKETRQEK